MNGYKALNLQYFFTSGKDEVKAWTVQVRGHPKLFTAFIFAPIFFDQVHLFKFSLCFKSLRHNDIFILKLFILH